MSRGATDEREGVTQLQCHIFLPQGEPQVPLGALPHPKRNHNVEHRQRRRELRQKAMAEEGHKLTHGCVPNKTERELNQNRVSSLEGKPYESYVSTLRCVPKDLR